MSGEASQHGRESSRSRGEGGRAVVTPSRYRESEQPPGGVSNNAMLPRALPAGRGRAKRTRKHIADPVAGLNTYIIHRIIHRRFLRGQRQWEVEWEGYTSKDNTWEFIENLAGCEDYIADFDNRQASENEAAAAAEAAARTERAAASQRETQQRDADEVEEAVQRADAVSAKKSKKKSPWWAPFDVPDGVENKHAFCTILVTKGNETVKCGDAIALTGCPTGLKSHMWHKHRLVWTSIDATIQASVGDGADVGCGTLASAMHAAPAWGKRRHDETDEKAAYWLVSSKRPMHTLQDEALRKLVKDASSGAYELPWPREAGMAITRMVEKGLVILDELNAFLRRQGLQGVLASDIWDDRGVSIFAVFIYAIEEVFGPIQAGAQGRQRIAFKLTERALCAIPFEAEKHTGANIEKAVVAELKKRHFPVGQPGMGVHDVVTDNGANVLVGFQNIGVGGGECGAHTSELSVGVLWAHERIKELVKKTKGITLFFSQIGGANVEHLHLCQSEYDLPRSKPKVWEEDICGGCGEGGEGPDWSRQELWATSCCGGCGRGWIHVYAVSLF
mmetsp:Transcript_43686/g.72772  ORF Transcript_43686/g.72772 Transcript_43686/m.72772 type:complete len:561 (+) Transcript_43686:281-1963(+)